MIRNLVKPIDEQERRTGSKRLTHESLKRLVQIGAQFSSLRDIIQNY